MAIQKLEQTRVAKPWGRHILWPGFENPPANEEPVGEIWFDDPAGADAALMVKYLFTSERLSIQVHPDDTYAQANGHKAGKEECWVILAAERDAELGLGLKEPTSAKALRAAALDGSITELMDWKPVKAGDIIYVSAGTIHAIGAGVTLIEIQQNTDITYRFYDYGRPRPLHLDEGLAVSHPLPFPQEPNPQLIVPGITVLTQGRKFVIEQWSGALDAAVPTSLKAGWIVVVEGRVTFNDAVIAKTGECWFSNGGDNVALAEGARVLLAYPGPDVAGDA